MDEGNNFLSQRMTRGKNPVNLSDFIPRPGHLNQLDVNDVIDQSRLSDVMYSHSPSSCCCTRYFEEVWREQPLGIFPVSHLYKQL